MASFQLGQRVNVPELPGVQAVVIGGSVDPLTVARWRLVWFQSDGAAVGGEYLDGILRNANQPRHDYEANYKEMRDLRHQAIDRAERAERALASLKASRKPKRIKNTHR